jgi:hypothetical protein
MARWLLRKGLKNSAAGEALSCTPLEQTSPIETVVDFQTAVVLYEAGGSFPDHSFSKLRERSVGDKGRVNLKAANRVEEFRQFNCRLAIAGMCRGSAFATAFGHPFAALATSFSRPVSAQCLNVLCSLNDDADGDDLWSAASAAALYRGRFVSSIGAQFSHLTSLIFAKNHRLRCSAAAGLAGFLVRRLFHHNGYIAPMHAQFVICRSACTTLALALHSGRHADERERILLQHGSRVRMRGLQSATSMNGRTGTICADFNADTGRWTVNIDATASDPASQGRFRPENLEVL